MSTHQLVGSRLSPRLTHLWMSRSRDLPALHAVAALLVEGSLEREALREAIHTVIQRHEILRTTFHRRPELRVPFQVVNADLPLSWETIGLHDRAPDEQEARIAELIESLRREAWDLERGPVVRVKLVALSPVRHVLLLGLAPLCADSRTFANMMREVSALCGLRSLDALPAEPIQYADFAEWHCTLLETDDEAARAAQAHWSRYDLVSQMAALPFALAATTHSFAPMSIEVRVPTDLATQLDAVSAIHETSPAEWLLASWSAFVSRMTGQDRLILGYIADGRPYEELHDALGAYAGSVPLLVEIEEGRSFLAVVRAMTTELRQATALQHHFKWGEAGPGFFPVCFEFAGLPEARQEGGLRFTALWQSVCNEPFVLKLSCLSRDNDLRITLHYDSSRVRTEDVGRLSGEFLTFLRSSLDQPDTDISRLELLTQAEREQLLAIGDPGARAVDDAPVHERFEAQAACAPERVAVICEDRQLTYAELEIRANQLARYLIHRGTGPESIVGLCVERSVEMIVALLGILKAGAAYLPMDPALPRDRLAWMLEEARASIVLTQAHLAPLFTGPGTRLVLIDRDWMEIAKMSPESPQRRVAPENLVYVIFTSGSSGRPKGVAVEHRHLSHYVTAISQQLGLPAGTSCATVTTLAADLGNTAIFPALCSGGTLHVVTQERASDAAAFAGYFQRHAIDCLKIVPSHLAALLAAPRPERVLPRKLLVLGGEAVRWELVDRVRGLAPALTIMNHYGPTETTVGVTTYRVTENDRDRCATVPIGRPIPNTQAYVLDPHLRPTPVWAPGELYIGGAGVARGYLNRPELTEERFVSHPYSEPGARLYKTGDRVRLLPDGNIEFIGRCDQQVKIRGYRVEPGEVEACLRRHPDVRDAVVLAREDELGASRLIAYLATAQKRAPSVEDLRSFLGTTLPDYMIPSLFVPVDTIPLTSNGKVDRIALLSAETGAEDSVTCVEPRTPAERTLAEIWADLLKLERVSIHENFFDLGGDSILAIQIIARANQKGLRLTLKQLFQCQTIAELAQGAGSGGVLHADQEIVTGIVPLTPIQHWFFEQDLAHPHHYNQALLLSVREPLDPRALTEAVRHLFIHHDALRLRFSKTSSGWVQVNAGADEDIPFSVIDLSGCNPGERHSLLCAEATKLQQGFDLSRGPLLRVALFTLGPDEPARLFLVAHHLVVDGVSWRVLLEDLWTAYQQARVGEEIRLPAKTTSFKQWAARLNEYAGSSELEPELAYWLSVPATPVARVPVDGPEGGANTMASSRTVTAALDVEETTALLHEALMVSRAQINDVLLASLGKALAEWIGEPRVLIDLEGHGRDASIEGVNLSRTVGWFTSRFPVYLEIGPGATPAEVLRSVKEQLRGLPNRGSGYGLLRYLRGDAAPADHLKALPQPQISVNYFGQLDQVIPTASPLSWADEAIGPTRSPRGDRRHLLAITARVIEGRLSMEWTYSENLHRRSTIERLAERWLQTLRAIIAESRASHTDAYTPSDFADAELKPDELSALLAELGDADE